MLACCVIQAISSNVQVQIGDPLEEDPEKNPSSNHYFSWEMFVFGGVTLTFKIQFGPGFSCHSTQNSTKNSSVFRAEVTSGQ